MRKNYDLINGIVIKRHNFAEYLFNIRKKAFYNDNEKMSENYMCCSFRSVEC